MRRVLIILAAAILAVSLSIFTLEGLPSALAPEVIAFASGNVLRVGRRVTAVFAEGENCRKLAEAITCAALIIEAVALLVEGRQNKAGRPRKAVAGMFLCAATLGLVSLGIPTSGGEISSAVITA